MHLLYTLIFILSRVFCNFLGLTDMEVKEGAEEEKVNAILPLTAVHAFFGQRLGPLDFAIWR
jgi:hypothetical protein